MKIVREPKVNGMFYPSDAGELKSMINSFLDEVEIETNYENIAGIVSPHAGYVYSGKTASAAYKTIVGHSYENVIVISPSHREYFPGLSIYSGDAYKTPLGDISINSELRNRMISDSKLIFSGKEGHGSEHALEVQLPFLQIVLPEFSLIPIVMGDQSSLFVDELAEVLLKNIDDKTLVVASSDLSHFYTKTEANKFDDRVANHINKFNYMELQNDLESRRCYACGGGGIVALMKALKEKGVKKTKVLMRTDSGDITGDDNEVVGYLSAVIYN